MDKVANLPPGDRAAMFEATAAAVHIASPNIVEKDFWVCWTLHRLYSRPGLPRMLFKGGTSLSKCFGLIHRFSEDIDLGLEREDLNFGEACDPALASSRKARAKAVKSLQAKVSEYVAQDLLPAITADFGGALEAGHDVRLGAVGSESVITFEYPRALGSNQYGAADYVASSVRLELGARSDHHPTTEVEVHPYAADAYPDEFEVPACPVIAQSPERTLLEKALILHTGNCRGRLPGQSSRHAYDLALMHLAGTTPSVTRELYEEVARHKLTFADDQHAGAAPMDGIRIVPEGDVDAALAADYRSMAPMFFARPAAPTWERVVEALGELEAALRAI